MTSVDLGKYTIEEVRAFWDQMVRRNPYDDGAKGEQHVLFRLGHTNFAIRASSCSGVVAYRQPSPLPVLPQHILGVAAVRGRPISVTDLGVLFGMKLPQKGGHLLLLKSEGEETAIRVDWVDSVIDLDLAHAKPPPAKWQGLRTGLVGGIVYHRFEEVIVINAARCIRAAEST